VNLLPRRTSISGQRRVRPPRVAVTWILLGAFFVVLLGRDLIEFLRGTEGRLDLVISIAVAGLAGSAVMSARVAGMEVEHRNFESESFGRILRALSRSVSPDAVVEAIVHELGAVTDADHVAVVRVRPGGTVMDVTFVSMLPGAPTSNTVMPLRQLEPVDASQLRDLPSAGSGRGMLRFGDRSPNPVVGDDPASGDQNNAANVATAELRRNVRARSTGFSAVSSLGQAHEVADRIAYRLRNAYGLRNTLAAPLQSERGIAGAIVLSRRTDEVWPDSAVRLLNSAAAETSAALTRVYSHQAAESEARTDQLTQLPNRRYFDEYCKLLTSRRRAADRVAILAVDVDHFKKVNDVYGHLIGDAVLRAIANAISVSVRDEDVPARYGGEEFVVLLRNPAAGVALEIGERIRRSVRDMDLTHTGIEGPVTVSVGVATGTSAGEVIEDIVERADRALYAAKRTGRDRVVEAWSADVAQ
jgi:diguanylate cyclase (GGDEF)-like protein